MELLFVLYDGCIPVEWWKLEKSKLELRLCKCFSCYRLIFFDICILVIVCSSRKTQINWKLKIRWSSYRRWKRLRCKWWPQKKKRKFFKLQQESLLQHFLCVLPLFPHYIFNVCLSNIQRTCDVRFAFMHIFMVCS